MSDKKTGGPAFPTSHSANYPTEIVGGMDLRDYFAASAPLATLKFEDAKTAADFAGMELPTTIDQLVQVGMTCAAKAAYMYADAMLAAREAA